MPYVLFRVDVSQYVRRAEKRYYDIARTPRVRTCERESYLHSNDDSAVAVHHHEDSRVLRGPDESAAGDDVGVGAATASRLQQAV